MRLFVLLVVVSLSGCLGAQSEGPAGTPDPAPADDRWRTLECTYRIEWEVFVQQGCGLQDDMGLGYMGDYEALEVTIEWDDAPPTALAVLGSIVVDDCQVAYTVCGVAYREVAPDAGALELSVDAATLERYASASWSISADVNGTAQEMVYDVTVRLLPRDFR